MTKAELRKIYLAKQKNLSAPDRIEKSRQIAENFFGNFDLSSVGSLHCFIPIEKFHEVDTLLFFQRLWTEFPHVRTLVPRVDFETDMMQSIEFSDAAALVRNKWGIREPPTGTVIANDVIDIVITPGICFDKELHRVGFGKGFYDRFLRSCRADCVRIGLNFFEPVEQITNVHDGDAQLDFLVTPDVLYKTEK